MAKAKFAVGDRVKVVVNDLNIYGTSDYSSDYEGQIGTVDEIDGAPYIIFDDEGGRTFIHQNRLELLEKTKNKEVMKKYKFAIGDKIIITNKDDDDYGCMGIVKEEDSTPYCFLFDHPRNNNEDENDSDNWIATSEQDMELFEGYRVEIISEIPLTKYKVGDVIEISKVEYERNPQLFKIVKEKFKHNFKVGDIVKITDRLEGDSKGFYYRSSREFQFIKNVYGRKITIDKIEEFDGEDYLCWGLYDSVKAEACTLVNEIPCIFGGRKGVINKDEKLVAFGDDDYIGSFNEVNEIYDVFEKLTELEFANYNLSSLPDETLVGFGCTHGTLGELRVIHKLINA